MSLDDAESIRRFVSQIKGEPENSKLSTTNTVASLPTPLKEQPTDQQSSALGSMSDKQLDQHKKSKVAKTSDTAVASEDNHRLTSPEAHPKPSPHVSGLKAPFNTPKTAASSPRLAAMNSHNEDVAEAFSEYVNTVDSRPLSESMWAPSARYRSSTLGGARSSKVLTPVKAVEPNPAINDTFDRMSFKAADPNHKIGENLIGERFTRALFSKAPPSFVNQFSVLEKKLPEGNIDDANKAKLKKTSDNDFKSSTEMGQKAQEAQVKAEVVGKESPNIAGIDNTEKENQAPPASKAYVPPHLRVMQVSSPKPISAETKPSSAEILRPVVMSRAAEPDSVKLTPRATANDVDSNVTTGSTGTKPLTDPTSASENLEHKAVFQAWPKQEERSGPGIFQPIFHLGSC